MKQLTLYCLNEPSLSPMRGEGWSIVMELHSFQQFCEFCQCNDINIRKGRLAEYIKMMVVGYDISGISSNSTIDKLVVVRICLNHLKMIVGSNMFYERTIFIAYFSLWRSISLILSSCSWLSFPDCHNASSRSSILAE